MLDKDVIWFALIECAFVSVRQLICVVCLQKPKGSSSVSVLCALIPFSFWYAININ